MGMQKACLVLLCVFGIVAALDNGLARTPPMGWNSWNHFGCNINETVIRQTADAIVSTGLKDHGYIYVNIDDCWAKSRDAQGYVHEDPVAFPSGIKALADYVHSKGLKFGIYSDAGVFTCAVRPGSLHYEKQDAETYAAWGVDYLKYDNCYDAGIIPEVRYPVMRDALNATGRPILFSLCEWGVDTPAKWAPAVGNSWRTTNDISDNWESFLSNLYKNDESASVAGPGQWNDPDMLEVGNGNMTDTEYRAHFSLWALVKAPLLIGCDVTNMSAFTQETLMNREVIAINQDSLGIQGTRVKSAGFLEVWAGKLADGGYAVVLFNRDAAAATITVNWADIGLAANVQAKVRDLWLHQDMGHFTSSYSAHVESHGVVMVRITPM
eukprot:TRINITY_DN167_c0_g4_i2.p1 TRINITY_DN167_c0_g4~~TRINITY_DN167_c0_g4_i2.p1  ORF type:complete len:398 (-),score=141.16 TRINITY_DN167_c0_g4_i2:65-1207(-)